MKSNYKRLGDYISPVNIRNTQQKVERLLGINIDKFFMPSVANVVGTDLSNYKLVRKNQFACNRMHVGRDYRLPVALSRTDEEFMVSPAYDVFEVKDTNRLNPEYLMMWFSRKEFDRNAWFYTDGDVRGGLPWKSFEEMILPIPTIAKQKEIVKEYNVIKDRIALNQQLIKKLEETAQAIYKQWFVDFEFPDENGKPYKSNSGEMVDSELGEIPKGWEYTKLSKIINIKDGTHDSPNPVDKGYPLVTSKHLNPYDIALNETYNISEDDYYQINKRSKVDKFDILFSMIGTIGLVNYVLYDKIEFAIKNVALFKTSERKEIAEYILFYLKSDYMKLYLASNPNGSTQNYVTLGFLREMPILLPAKSVLLIFEDTSKKIIESIQLKVNENNILSKLKELLLSKLATVEVTV